VILLYGHQAGTLGELRALAGARPISAGTVLLTGIL
jgi:hypothetical protein